MRITREHLIRNATETTAQRVRADRTIVSAFLAGSVLSEEPLIGGTADIDLFFIHDSEPLVPHEIVRISPEVHLDIIHHSQTLYHHPRRLRMDPQMGFILYSNPLLLHDTQHWFEFIQASVRSQFWQAENVLARVRPLLDRSRQLWSGLQNQSSLLTSAAGVYLEALELAANAVACLTSGPLPVRRFLIDFPQRAEAVGHAHLGVGLPALIGAGKVDAVAVRSWLPAWNAALTFAASQSEPATDFLPPRRAYFERALDALIDGGPPGAGLWILLYTWNAAVSIVSGVTDIEGAFDAALQQLDLTPPALPDRFNGLDAYLDSVEEVIEGWAAANGIS